MRSLTLLLVVALPLSAANAQWRLSLVSGSATVAGHARNDSDPDRPELHPDRPASLALGLARDAGAWRMNIDGRRTTADLVEAGSTTAVVTRDALAAWEFGLEVARRVAGQSGGPTLHASVGAVLDRWTFVDITGPARWRSAGRAALEAEVPISAHWAGLLRGEVTIEPSIFNTDELPDDFSKQLGVRLGLMLGIARKW